MDPAAGHRKRVKHYDEPGQGHELTFSCYQRLRLLDDDHRCKHLAVAVDRAIRRNGFSLLAFVFMPEHVHLIVFPEEPTVTGGLQGATGGLPASAAPRCTPAPISRISTLLYGIKRPASYRIKQDLVSSNDPLLKTLTIRERPGKMTFRFWQEGSGYDRNILGHESLRKMIDYVHLNPVRRGLVDHPIDWKWSSWGHYAGESNETPAGLPDVSLLI